MANRGLDRIKRTLYLDSRNGWIAGVCAGLANYFNTDPTIVRVIALVAGVFLTKIVIAAYLVAWLVLDEAPRKY
ncbi:MAG: PspC domain-containing protein [Pseudomonadales bacterium]|jgi:phage shock protein C|nr:PspC domain-containing protein [Pseudomonadales bacterium]MDP6471049.1 PspC domain-containing protein [Pseudomonadales bacterium]MDP6825765.1 PspC domain-containing protein [Pseudomonadales bacterium]MDP6970241.1 PspC domain-containing protein [Pseudomonadales bacterium]|tara:strand:- start:1791 stop:2012 length:222 start_codon:yes stop_codon:yes gene_type:complete